MESRDHASKRIRYAVVGLGYIAQIAVLPAFAHARRNSALTAIVSGDAKKLSRLGDKYRVPIRATYDDLDRVLAEVDAVYIASPNSLHAPHTIRAAERGVHVLCEKPLALTVDECARMMDACRRAGVKLMTAYRLHFEPLMLEVLATIRANRIGPVRFVSSTFSMHATLGGIRTRPETGGGTLYDLGVYCINAARMIYGEEPVAVSAFSADGARAGMPGVDDATTAILKFSEGRLATFTTSFAAADTASLHIVGVAGNIHMDPAYEYAEPLRYTLRTKDRTIKRRGRKRDQFAAELLYFSDCVQNDREPEPSGEEGTRDVRIVNALYESSRTGRVVELLPVVEKPAPREEQAIDRPPVSKPGLVNVQEPHS
jgi:glucose-fructose oxidoreductase